MTTRLRTGTGFVSLLALLSACSSASAERAELPQTASAEAAACAPAPAPGPLQSYGDQAAIFQNDATNVQYDVLTQHNDLARTGASTHENILTPSNVKSGFGYLGSVPVSGKIYAQPLYVENAAVSCGGAAVKNANIAYVATLDNIVYAIDVQSQAICWKTPTLGCGENGDPLLGFNPEQREGPGAVTVGIVSTPVVDLAKSIMYAVTREFSGSPTPATHFFVNSIDTRTGALVGRAEVKSDGTNGCNNLAFQPAYHNNRPGLALVQNKLFLGFGSTRGEDDEVPYHGFVIGFDVSDPSRPTPLARVFCSTPNSIGGGIWQSGGGLASDGSAIYLMTGNGAYQFINGDIKNPDTSVPEGPKPGDYADSFVKLPLSYFNAGSTTPVQAYTDQRRTAELQPSNPPPPNQPPNPPTYRLRNNGFDHTIYWGRERADADLGSGGTLLLGGRVIGGGKDGRLYLLNAADMAHRQSFQAFVDGDNGLGTDASYSSMYSYQQPYYSGPNIHGAPLAWDVSSRGGGAGTYVYAWSEKDSLKRFEVRQGLFTDTRDATPANPVPSPHGEVMSQFRSMPGGFLSLSANGATNGIVWGIVEEPYPTKTSADDQHDHNPAARCGPGLATGEACGGCMVGPNSDTFVEYCDATQGYVQGRLYAFAADDNGRGLLPLLWGDKRVPAGKTPNNLIRRYSKFTSPTIAHGKVIVATGNNEVQFYGLKSSPAPARRADDLMAVWPESNSASFAMYRSNGPTAASFAPHFAWATKDGGWNPTNWMAGDYDGDGISDVVNAWPNGFVGPTVLNGLAMRRSTGNASAPYETTSQWAGTLSAIPNTNPTQWTWNRGGDGTWNPTAQWLSGDYDGDGRTDVVTISNDGTNSPSLSVFRAASNGIRFEHSFLWSWRDAGWIDPPNINWVSGDFDGDGLSDIAAIWNDNGANRITVRRSLRSAFEANWHWIVPTGTYAPNTKWFAGDFDGDGLSDIASAEKSGDSAVFRIYRSTGTQFQLVYTGNPDGGWGNDVKMVAGDFNADGKADIAAVWNKGNLNDIVVRTSTGTGFAPAQSWQQPGGFYGGWEPSTVWLAGKFRR
ncbi:VCBS repeat-containing protein [Pendulispora rubella]|uniref:VCBS repeat-containing protein n=1 Tax=Pendulispora rubella TaxID=2741070 RepID=A0ABZ2KPX8_9BACT